MLYERDSIAEIRSRILRTLEAAAIPYSFKGLLGSSLAGMSHMLHGHIDYLAHNMLPDSAKDEVLERWAEVWGITRHRAKGPTIRIIAKGTPGEAVPAQWVVGGVDFRTADGAIFNAQGEAMVVCCGDETPRDFGLLEIATVKIASPNMETEAKILARTPELPQESDDSLRRRLFRAIQMVPQGGASLDYIRWIETIPGVKKAWVKPWHLVERGKPGHVWVTWLEEALEQSDATKKTIEDLLSKLAPAHAVVTVKALVVDLVPLEIKLDPNTAACKEAVALAINKFFCEESVPGGYLNEKYEKTKAFVSKSRLDAAISAIPDEISHTVLNLHDDIPIGDGRIVKCQVKFV